MDALSQWSYELADSTVLKDVIILGLGLAGGYATSYYFNRKQNLDGETSHSELVAALDKNYEQVLRNGIKNANIIHTLKSVKDEVEGLSDLVEIKGKIDESLVILKGLKKGKELPLDEIFRYKTLGDKWSELAFTQLNLNILDSEGKIDIDRLFAVHRNIFPDNFPWAGRYRDQHVYVIENFGTTTRVVDAVKAESKVGTIAPEAIEENLIALIGHWNINITGQTQRSSTVKIEEVAHFHHEFELIHPFLDGNGRIGRMLLEEQLSYLFQTKIIFRADQNEYYSSLRMMNSGDTSEFIKIITQELKKFNAAL